MTVGEIDRRLKRTYKPSKVKFLWNIEDIVDDCYCTDYFTDLYLALQLTIKAVADSYGRRWANKRLSSHDFESVFWLETYKLFKKYTEEGLNPDFVFFETLKLMLERRATDVIRKATKTKKGAIQHDIDSLGESFEQTFPDTVDTEKEVTDRIFVDMLIADETLTDDERQLLEIIYVNPGATLRELAEQTEFNHPEKVKRAMNRIRKKIAKYKEFFDDENKSYQPYRKN